LERDDQTLRRTVASTLHHHPDGHVYVRTAAGVYGDTPENFALDYGSAWPALPEGMTERLYVQETRHALMARHDLADGGPMPWPEGDAIIAGIARLLEAQRARVAAQVAAARAARAAERDAAIMPVQRRQFFQELARRGEITRAEALAAVRTGDIPARLQAFIDANLTGDDRFTAEILLSGAAEFRRDHALCNAIGAGLGWTSDQIDDLWRAASRL
jgi:hypothetical protein